MNPSRPTVQTCRPLLGLAIPLLLCGLGVAMTLGCSTGNYTRSVHGTSGGYSLANTQPKLLTHLVAQKLDRPLFIVLDPFRVADTWPLETRACATNSPGCERFALLEVQTFVRRDLKKAMESYFSRVEVIESTLELPSTPHVVADVKLDSIQLNELLRGAMTHTLIEMNWGFAMRLSGQLEYVYSFAGIATSNDSYPTFEQGCATLIENAIPPMIKDWTENGGLAAIRDAGLVPAAQP